MSKDQKLEVRIDEALEQITDLGAKLLDTDRSKLVRKAIRNYVKKIIRENEQRTEILLDEYLSGEVDYVTLQDILGHEDARAIRASKELYDRMDETIDDIAKEL